MPDQLLNNMGKKRTKSLKAIDNIAYSGIVLGVIYWIFEASVHVFIFKEEGTLLQHLFDMHLHEFWMRSLVVSIIIIFAFYAQTIINRSRRANAELNHIFNAAVPLCVIDKNYNVIRVNERFSSLFGMPRDEILSKICCDIGEGTLCNTPGCLMMQILGGKELCECEVTKKLKSGRIISCVVTATPYRDLDGEIIGIVENFTDITKRKQAEQLLQSERDKFKGVLNAIGEGMYIVNQDFTIEYQNQILDEHFPGVIGDKCYTSYMQFDKPCEFCPLQKTIESDEIQQIEIIRSDGQYMDIVYSPFIDVDGKAKMIILLRDITEKMTSEAETMRAAHLASIGELAAGVAHEINNPINSIINLAQILYNDIEQGSSERDIAKRIIKEGDRIAHIVYSLLSFARERKESKGPVNMHGIMNETLSLVGSLLRKDNIDLKVEIAMDLPDIIAHPQQIQQIFLNILNNSRYALNQKYPGIDENKTLIIQGQDITENEHKYVRIIFLDKGIGIPKNIIKKVINPFYSSKPPGKGTGLGLSITHGIVSNHGGKLKIESIEGEFTKVTIDFPVGDKNEC